MTSGQSSIYNEHNMINSCSVYPVLSLSTAVLMGSVHAQIFFDRAPELVDEVLADNAKVSNTGWKPLPRCYIRMRAVSMGIRGITSSLELLPVHTHFP